KSTVSNCLERSGGMLFDADICVHQLMEHNKKVIEEIQYQFPNTVKGGKIDRGLLAASVFENDTKLKKLESVLHPYVRDEEVKFIETAVMKDVPFVVMDIPLLFETGAEELCDIVIVTDCDPTIQMERALEREGMTKSRYSAIINRQMISDKRKEKADYIVKTDGADAELMQQLEHILQKEGLT
ncbi:MAG: dephospho-CoA kinase, partial [Rickettsiales bacterium]|nr:dephospho-CoA kinase [Rickettsiales bacterium]